jgi:hypothetical protein
MGRWDGPNLRVGQLHPEPTADDPARLCRSGREDLDRRTESKCICVGGRTECILVVGIVDDSGFWDLEIHSGFLSGMEEFDRCDGPKPDSTRNTSPAPLERRIVAVTATNRVTRGYRNHRSRALGLGFSGFGMWKGEGNARDRESKSVGGGAGDIAKVV